MKFSASEPLDSDFSVYANGTVYSPLSQRTQDKDKYRLRIDAMVEKLSFGGAVDSGGGGVCVSAGCIRMEHMPSRQPYQGHHSPARTMPVIHTGELEDSPCRCAGCGGKIVDRYYLLAVDKQWHLQCLKCCECKLRLDSELTCFARDGSIYCKEDYYRRFAVKRCARCQMGISANELVMRAKDLVYHLHCFTCASCNKALTTGETFGMKDSMVYCHVHYEMSLQGEYMPNLSPSLPSTHPAALPYYNGVGTVQKGRPRKRKSPCPDPDSCNSALGLGPNENESDHSMSQDGYNSQAPRQKRMRTSFKHHQLRTMKSYFALNHNPDAKDLKQLAQKTGLTKRVLQVWFQNARAKYRRNMLRQEQQQSNADKMNKDNGSLADLSNAHSPALSDISSTPSLSELHNSSMDQENSSGSTSLTELFSNSINSIN